MSSIPQVCGKKPYLHISESQASSVGVWKGLMAPQWDHHRACVSRFQVRQAHQKAGGVLVNFPSEQSTPHRWWVVQNALIWHLVFWYVSCVLVSIGRNSPFRQPVKWLPLLRVQVGYRTCKHGVSKLGYDPPSHVRAAARGHPLSEVGCAGWVWFRGNPSNSARRVWRRE